MRRLSLAATLFSLAATQAGAQQANCPLHAAHTAAAAASPRKTPSPYAGQETRKIKALSDEQIRGYREGHGVGLALAAELNHYPGPRHVLDLGRELSLTDEQSARLKVVYEGMAGQAKTLGAELVDREERLDRRFAEASIDEDALRASTAAIARLQGELRRVHLQAHLDTRALLTPAQVRQYDELRGYTGPAASGPHAH
jgi:Spy/CpxP family protein refolding chaperone